MSAIRVPNNVLAWVERHLRGSGQPLLYGPRAETDTPLRAVPCGDGRWQLMIEPESSLAMLYAEAAILSEPPNPEEKIALALTRAAATAMRGLPTHFTDQTGRVVAVFEVEETLVTVYGARAVSLVAWLLSGRQKRTGLYVTVNPPLD